MLSQVFWLSFFDYKFSCTVFTINAFFTEQALLLKNTITIITLSVCVFTFKGVQYEQGHKGRKIYEKSNLYERNDCRRWIKCYL